MTAFCRDHGVAHEICGKLVVATEPDREQATWLAFLLALFPIFVNSLTGLGEIEPDILDLSRLAGGSLSGPFGEVVANLDARDRAGLRESIEAASRDTHTDAEAIFNVLETA